MGRLGNLLVAAVAAAVTAGTVVAGCASSPPSTQGSIEKAAPEAVAAAASAPRPNVLVIEADDMRVDDLPYMPRTRHWFQDRGLTFESSFSPNPLCCPARASFLTGRYSHNHGVLSHREPYGFGSFDDHDTLATRLSEAGYRTALVGKYLNGYGIDPVHGTDSDPSVTYVPPGWTQWYGSVDVSTPPANPYGGSTYNYFHLTSNVNGVLQSWPDEYTTDVTAAQTRNVIFRFEAAREPKPWFVWWTPVAPHHGDPDEDDDPADAVNRRGGVEHWLSPARPEWVKGRFDDVIPRSPGTPRTHQPEENRADKPRYLRYLPYLSREERTAVRDITRQRAEALYALDAEVDKVMTMLQRRGLLDSTMIVFTSDNGFYLGEHLKREGKGTPHEPSIRVPLLVAGPGVTHGRRYDPVSTVDLGPTIASWAGTSLARPDGDDLSRLIQDGDRGWDRAVVVEGLMGEPAYDPSLGHTGPLSYVGLRTGRWEVVRYASGETEWYDLWRDPLQLSSLQFRGVPPVVRDALRQALRQYGRCAEEACRAPLPEVLREDADDVRRILEHQRQAEDHYYG